MNLSYDEHQLLELMKHSPITLQDACYALGNNHRLSVMMITHTRRRELFTKLAELQRDFAHQQLLLILHNRPDLPENG